MRSDEVFPAGYRAFLVDGAGPILQEGTGNRLCSIGTTELAVLRVVDFLALLQATEKTGRLQAVSSRGEALANGGSPWLRERLHELMNHACFLLGDRDQIPAT